MIPPLAPTFDAALRDVRAQHPRFRMAAAERLGDPPAHRRREAIDGLRTLARDDEGEVRAAAFESLGVLKVIGAVELMQDAFFDPHPDARQAAVLALGRADPLEAEARIAPLLDDPRPEMRFSAVWTLSSIDGSRPNSIRAALMDSDADVRALTAERLGALHAEECRDDIALLLEDDVEGVRFAAATALASLGDARAAPTLRAALAHPAQALRAAVGLGDLRDRGAHSQLSKLARRRWRTPIVRAAAARALVRLNDPEGVKHLRGLVRSWRIEARQYAVEIVGELGLHELLPDLAIALRRSAEREHAVYETALERLAPQSAEARELLASIRAADHAG